MEVKTCSRCGKTNKKFIGTICNACYCEDRNRAKGVSPKNYRTPEQVKEYKAKWAKKNREQLRIKNREWSIKNKDQDLTLKKKWRDNNKESCQKQRAKWNKDNKLKKREYRVFRRAQEKLATPKWVNRSELQEIYTNCPEGYHVDHIVPLVHDQVCGLHVVWNLQYLTATENLKKSNKLLPQ